MTDSWMDGLTGGKKCLVLVVALLVGAQFGCGGDKAGTTVDAEMTPDQMAISARVSGVSDMSNQLSRLRDAFTKDNAPKSSDLSTYEKNYFEVDGDIVVSGTTATFPVKISSYTTEVTAQKQWKAEKVGDTWLLSETPLP